MHLLQVVAILFSVALLAAVVETTRRKLLNARYAILWLGAGAVLLGLSVHRPLLDWIALRLGVAYPPSLLFLVAFAFLLLIVLHYALVLSTHRDAIRSLGQNLALLEHRVEELSRGDSPGKPTRGTATRDTAT